LRLRKQLKAEAQKLDQKYIGLLQKQQDDVAVAEAVDDVPGMSPSSASASSLPDAAGRPEGTLKGTPRGVGGTGKDEQGEKHAHKAGEESDGLQEGGQEDGVGASDGADDDDDEWGFTSMKRVSMMMFGESPAKTTNGEV
jgi:hypothetical protein